MIATGSMCIRALVSSEALYFFVRMKNSTWPSPRSSVNAGRNALTLLAFSSSSFDHNGDSRDSSCSTGSNPVGGITAESPPASRA
jgi:hypothetical protein